MKKAVIAFFLPLVILSGCLLIVGQEPAKTQPDPDLAKDYVLEVMYYKGARLAYQRLTNWTWYGRFQMVDGWKPKPGEEPLQAVKIVTLQQPGPTTIRVKLMRGEHLDIEETVGDYLITEKKTVVEDLRKHGIVPFELRLVRAPAKVADLPAIKNHTKSLVVSVEPTTSVLPTFKAIFLNNANKAVMAISYTTTIGERRRFIGRLKNMKGGSLIAPGEVYKRDFPYAYKGVTESTGDVPEAESGLQFNVLAVIFEDGSWEGLPSGAIGYKGAREGEKIQLRRILEVLRSPAANSVELLVPKADELTFRITKDEIRSLLEQFPGLTDHDVEEARTNAEIAAADVQKSFKANFGKGSPLNAENLAAAVKAAIERCERLLEAIP